MIAWTSQMQADLVSLYADGLSFPAIARHLLANHAIAVSRDAIVDQARRMDLPPRARHVHTWTAAQIARLRELTAAGDSTWSIGQKMDLSRSVIEHGKSKYCRATDAGLAHGASASRSGARSRANADLPRRTRSDRRLGRKARAENRLRRDERQPIGKSYQDGRS